MQSEGLEAEFVSRAKELCPDYPFSGTFNDALWCLTSTIEGTRLACDDLHALIKELETKAQALAAERDRLREALTMVFERWSFDDRQWHTHTWHDKQECVDVVRKALTALGESRRKPPKEKGTASEP